MFPRRSVGEDVPVVILDVDLRQQSGVIQSFGKAGISVIAVSSHSDCAAFHSKFVVDKIVSPHPNDGVAEYIDFLCNIQNKGVLVYSCDANTMLISNYQEKLKSAGFLLNIPSPTLLESLFDKWHCYELLHDKVPMAKTSLITSVADIDQLWDDFNKPVILKGTRMAGGNYIKINHKNEIGNSYNDLQSYIVSDDYKNRNSGVILQEWMTYDMTDMWSCETVYDQNSNPLGFFTIQRIRSSLNDSGSYTSRLHAGEYVYSRKLIELTENILSSVDWKGFAHVEYFYVPSLDKFLLTEVNPRLPGYSYFPSRAGFDMAVAYYSDLVGWSYQTPEKFPASVFFTSFHLPGDLSQGLYHVMKGHLKLLPFINSYGKLFKPSVVRIVDPIRFEDPRFTMFSLFESVVDFCNRLIGFIKKRMISIT